jgi:hypothetical protein
MKKFDFGSFGEYSLGEVFAVIGLALAMLVFLYLMVVGTFALGGIHGLG